MLDLNCHSLIKMCGGTVALDTFVKEINWLLYSRIVDIGGGYGSLLRKLLKDHTNLEGLLFDQPNVSCFTQHCDMFSLDSKSCFWTTCTHIMLCWLTPLHSCHACPFNLAECHKLAARTISAAAWHLQVVKLAQAENREVGKKDPALQYAVDRITYKDGNLFLSGAFFSAISLFTYIHPGPFYLIDEAAELS